MKKNNLILILLLLSILLFTGCSNTSLSTKGKINIPENNLLPINGTWKVLSYKSIGNSSIQKNSPMMNKNATFSKNLATFSDKLCKNPNYRLRVVNSNDYLMYKHKVLANDLNITTNKLTVISVTSNDKLFYDFIKVDDKLIVEIDNLFYFLTKQSDSISFDTIPKDKSNVNDTLNKKQTNFNTGLLLGLRNTSSDHSQLSSTYRTFWISTKDNVLQDIDYSKNLLVPRKSDFWEMGINRTYNSGLIEEKLFAKPFNIKSNKYSTKNKKEEKGKTKDKEKDTENVLTNSKKNNLSMNKYKDILFVSNDYVSTETYWQRKNTSNLSRYLRIMPIDNIKNPDGIKISDLLGSNGTAILYNSSNIFLSNTDKNTFKNLEKIPKQNNLKISRKNNYWVLEGRLNTLKGDDYKDFIINTPLPKKVINYDESYVSWNEVKSKVQEALDVFTSPNKDFAIIICKTKILVYKLENGTLNKSPIKELPIQETESVVMAEWSVGDYVENWAKTFKTFKKHQNK